MRNVSYGIQRNILLFIAAYIESSDGDTIEVFTRSLCRSLEFSFGSKVKSYFRVKNRLGFRLDWIRVVSIIVHIDDAWPVKSAKCTLDIKDIRWYILPTHISYVTKCVVRLYKKKELSTIQFTLVTYSKESKRRFHMHKKCKKGISFYC